MLCMQSSVGKEQRRYMHEAIRQHFPMLESETADSDEKAGDKVVIIQHGNKQKKGAGLSVCAVTVIFRCCWDCV